MEILTLLKANIRHKKGAFKSIIILMFIITACTTAILSTNDNIHRSLNASMERINAGDIAAWCNPSADMDAIEKGLDDDKNVASYRIEPVIITNSQTINGKQIENNSYEIMPWNEIYPVINEKGNQFAKKQAPLKTGETYVPISFSTLYNCKVGSKIVIDTENGKENFTIKGFVEEPLLGASMIGIKTYFVSEKDFDKIHDMALKGTPNVSPIIPYKLVHVFQKEESTLSPMKFKKSVNESSKLIDNCFISLSKEASMGYTTALSDILSGILYAFLILLFAIAVIMICHNLSSGIEMEYTTLGILKAMGFSKKKIRIVFILQYMLAEIIGIVLGLIAAYPLTILLCSIYRPVIGIITDNHISILKMLLIALIMIIFVYIMVLILTHKISRISPVRAISGGHSPIYFSNRFTLAIRKNLMSLTLGFRQFTTNPKQYAGTLIISAILVFFMMSMNLLGNSMSSSEVMNSFGVENFDIEAEVCNKEVLDNLDELKTKVEKISSTELFTGMNSEYISLEGSDIHTIFYTDPTIPGQSLLKGRCPLYDNEFLITEKIAEEYNLHIGDKVNLSLGDKEAEYIVSGLYQSTYDMGVCMAMGYDAYKRIGKSSPRYLEIKLADATKIDEVVKMLNDTYKGKLEAAVFDDSDSMNETIDLALTAIGILIYSISILFTLVTVNMVCQKSFLKERMDIGIYKAVGFTIHKLRLQFAVRFLIVSLFGSLLGILLCVTCCKPMLEFLLRNMGITNFITKYSISTILIPVAIIGICFFLFSYVSSRKIKKVAVRELVVE